MNNKTEKIVLPLTITIILLASLYRFAESSLFLEKIILPVIERQTDCQITADQCAFSLPGRIRMHNVKIIGSEANFQVKADILTADISLIHLVNSSFAVKKLTMQNAAGYYSYHRSSQQTPLMITWKNMELYLTDLLPDYSAQLSLNSHFNLPHIPAEISYGGYLQANSVITLSKSDNKISTQTKGHIADLQANQAESASEEFDVTFSLTCTAGFNEQNEFRSFRIKKFETKVSASLDNEQELLAHLAVNGNIFPSGSNRQNRLQVSSKKLNLQLLNFLTLSGVPADKRHYSPSTKDIAFREEQNPTKSTSLIDTDEGNRPVAPQLENLGNVKTAVDLNLKNISYGSVFITHLLGSIEQTDHSLQTAFATDSLNSNSSLKARAQMKNNRDKPKYSLELSLRDFLMSPLLTTFPSLTSPSKLNGYIDVLKLRLNCRGRYLQNIKHNLEGQLMADFAKISINNLHGLHGLAERYKLPGITNLQFDKGRLRSRIKNGHATLNLARIHSDNLYLQLNGYVGLDSTLKTSLRIGVGGNLKKRLIKRGFQPVLGETVNGFRGLRISIPIEGTLENPEVDFSLSRLFRQSMKNMKNKWLKNIRR